MADPFADIRYRGKLFDLLDQLYLHGFVVVPYPELMLWAGGRRRETEKLWENIKAHWIERCIEDWGMERSDVPNVQKAWDGKGQQYLLVIETWDGDIFLEAV